MQILSKKWEHEMYKLYKCNDYKIWDYIRRIQKIMSTKVSYVQIETNKPSLKHGNVDWVCKH